MLLPHEDAEYAQTDKFIWTQLEQFGCTMANAEIERRTEYSIPGSWAETFAKGRLILAGDSAHQAPQFLGQGLNSGLRDAKGIMWRVDHALRNPDCDWSTMFEEYSSEQLGVTQEFVAAAKAVEKVLIVTDPDQAKARDIMVKQNALGFRSLDQFRSPGMWIDDQDNSHPVLDGSGALFIHDKVEFHGGQQDFLDTFTGPGWVLLSDAIAGGLEGSLVPETYQEFVRTCRGKLVEFAPQGYRDVSGRYTNWLRERRVVAVLVRPDFYVYATAKSAKDIQPLLDGLLRRLR